MQDKVKHPLDSIVRQDLSGIDIVPEYIQFRFSGCHLTILSGLELNRGDGWLKPTDSGYYDALCSCLSRTIATVLVKEREVFLTFDNEVSFRVNIDSRNNPLTKSIMFSSGPLDNWSI